MVEKHIYPAVPEPQPTLPALYESVKTLKIAVEMLTGQRPLGRAAQTFVQTTQPVTTGVGDLWIEPTSGSLQYWNGSAWVAL